MATAKLEVEGRRGAPMTETRTSFCRICQNCCPVEVEVDDGRAVRVTGDKTNPIWDGFTCVKGREQPKFHNSPDRLLAPLRRDPGGGFASIGSAQALDEIAERLRGILAESGPRAIASYTATQAHMAAIHSVPMINAFFAAIDSPMLFTSNTIDQPGKFTAMALHGRWLAPSFSPDEAEVLMLVGANPLISMYGLPSGNMGRWLTEARGRGVDLIVIDPRRTESARRASVHLQPRPGHDVHLLTAMAHVILAEGLADDEFVAAHVTGLARLRTAVAPYSPHRVAETAGVAATDIITAARMYAGRARGYIHAGTGANMAQSGTLLEYMVLVLGALCGHRTRAGHTLGSPLSLFPPIPAVAQAMDPFPASGYGEHLRVRGLTDTPAGMPTAALSDEILLEGEGQVRALFVTGGNPVASWPDRIRSVAAMERLDLLVVLDPFLSQTASYAHYVLPPRMALEKPGASQMLDFLNAGFNCGVRGGFAQHTAPVVSPPSGSDLTEEWEVFFGLAQRLGLELSVPHLMGLSAAIPVDMARRPSDEEMLDIVCAGSRVPLSEVRGHPHGVFRPDPPVVVQAGDPACSARLDVGNAEMMADLDQAIVDARPPGDEEMVLISRREMHLVNSGFNVMKERGGRAHNPAYMNPVDIERLGLEVGGLADIESPRARVTAIVAVDESVRAGVVSMSHSFGIPGADADPWTSGTSTAELIDATTEFDRYSGQPRMSAILVRVHTARSADHGVAPFAAAPTG
jgi:anaerobic selenocysteine-containing dehydrogenase